MRKVSIVKVLLSIYISLISLLISCIFVNWRFRFEDLELGLVKLVMTTSGSVYMERCVCVCLRLNWATCHWQMFGLQSYTKKLEYKTSSVTLHHSPTHTRGRSDSFKISTPAEQKHVNTHTFSKLHGLHLQHFHENNSSPSFGKQMIGISISEGEGGWDKQKLGVCIVVQCSCSAESAWGWGHMCINVH